MYYLFIIVWQSFFEPNEYICLYKSICHVELLIGTVKSCKINLLFFSSRDFGGKSKFEKYPRSCAKEGFKSPPSNSKIKRITDVAKAMSNKNKIQNLAQQQCYYEDAEEMQNKETSLGIDKAGTVTITKDLWSEVQQCLRLMTSVFSQLNNECNEEKDLAMHCNEGPSQRQPCLKRASVRQRLFDDTNSSPALVPKGKIVEKIFIKKKGSNTTSIELASRETFLHNETNKISEIDGLDSACCNRNSCDTSYEDYSLSSPSKPMKDELVSETTKGTHAASSGIKASIEKNSCTKFSADLKSSPVSTAIDKYRTHTSSYDQPALQFSSPKRFDGSGVSTKKKRRPRYRLVRRRSSLCKTQGRSAEATSEHESDPGLSTKTTANASGKGPVARNKHSFDHCLSDREDFRIPEKTMKTNVLHHRPAAESSPEIDDVILVEAPPKLGRPQAVCSGTTPVQCSSMCPSAISRNETSVMSGSSGGHCHSSTPRKYGEFKDTAPSANVARRSGSVETMPSPIKSTSVTETLASTTVMSNNSLLPSSIAMESHSECSFSQPDISISSLAKKDIFKRSTSSDNERNTKSNTRSSKDSDVYERLFPGFPQERVSFSPADDPPKKGRSKKNEHEIVMLGSDGSSGSTLNRNPEVVSYTKPLLEENYDRTKSRSELCATNKKLLCSKSTSMLESSDYLPGKESKIISSRKRNRTKHSSEHFTRLSNEHRHSLQLKITPSREKHHPYATSTKFPRIPPSHSPSQSSSIRTPALIPPLQGLSIKSPSSPSHKWSTLDRSPMAICFKEAQQISDPVVACRTILKFGSDSHPGNKKMSRGEARPRNKVKKATMRTSNITDHRLENNDSRSDCSNGKCLKAFCFNCSMELS